MLKLLRRIGVASLVAASLVARNKGMRFLSRKNKLVTGHDFGSRSLVFALLVSGCATGSPGCPGNYYTPGLLEAAIAAAWDAAVCSGSSGTATTTTSQNSASQQAQAELRESVSAELSEIDPLAVPLAPKAIVILPARDMLLLSVKAGAASGVDDTALVPQVNLLSYYTQSWALLIKKRGIFENTLVVRSNAEVKTEGRYVVLIEYNEEKREFEWFLLPPGGRERSWVFSGSPLGIGVDKTSAFLKEIEDFVKRHKAETTTTG
jgi:hypothetical protein